MNRFEVSYEIYKKALDRARCNCLEEAFDSYVDAFLLRITSAFTRNNEFIAFYRYQLATYLEKKNNFLLGLIEGDMVSDLIECTYEKFNKDIKNSDISISKANRFNLLENIHIIFPGLYDPSFEEDELPVSK